MMGMGYKNSLNISLAVSFLTLSAFFYYTSNLHSLVRVVSVKTVYSNHEHEKNDFDSNDFNKSDIAHVVPFKRATPAIIKRLSTGVLSVERDVLTFNAEDILKSLSDVPFEESRLIHKIQKKQKHSDFDCFIRIAKYCSSRCDHLVQGKHSTEWTRFRCDVSESCQVETRLVGNLTYELMQTIDVVFFTPAHSTLHLMHLIYLRPPGQLWILYSRESPHHDYQYAPEGLTGNPFNLTMTYARDSDIHFPYAALQKKRKQIQHPKIPRKTKLIAWMASNCQLLSWKRTELVKELQRHISVDAYGKCGNMGKLPRDDDTIKALQKYKFYLAFENSECRDYITEKVWKTCLMRGIVPIVYGSTRESYEKTLPKDSFIFLEDFSNMSAFVDYIHVLDADKARYRKYFDWKIKNTVNFMHSTMFSIQSPKLNMCYLLKKLTHVFFHPESSWQKRTPDFASWWNGQCLDPTREKDVLGFSVH
nr:alpha-(1,3)-fucosyltransferase 4-like [Lytechinus pictus]